MLLAILYVVLLVLYAIAYPDWADSRSRNGGIVSVLLFVIIGIKLFWSILN